MAYIPKYIKGPGMHVHEMLPCSDQRQAMYLACGLLQADPPLVDFWIEGPDGLRIADQKKISDYADQAGYPNPWRESREKKRGVMPSSRDE